MVSEGTYRSACGCLLHRRRDAAGHVRWEAEDDDGRCRDIELADWARPALLSDDPDWPSGMRRVAVPVLEPD